MDRNIVGSVDGKFDGFEVCVGKEEGIWDGDSDFFDLSALLIVQLEEGADTILSRPSLGLGTLVLTLSSVS